MKIELQKPNKILGVEVEKNVMTIRVEVDPSKATPSKTGKSEVVATTGGFAMVNNGMKLSLNIIQ